MVRRSFSIGKENPHSEEVFSNPKRGIPVVSLSTPTNGGSEDSAIHGVYLRMQIRVTQFMLRSITLHDHSREPMNDELLTLTGIRLRCISLNRTCKDAGNLI